MIDKLDFLLALARERHFGRAAETCGVTQPTLSAGVKQLEETLGVLLVNRGSRFQSFTPEGERVLDWARRIVGDSRAMRQEINALRHGLTGRLRISAIPTALGMVASLTTPYPHAPSQCAIHRSVAHLDRDAGPARKSRDRRRHHLSRQRAARPRQHGAALSRALSAAHLGRCAARQPRQRHLGGSRRGAALPADARHAEPPHHRPPAASARAASHGRCWNRIR